MQIIDITWAVGDVMTVSEPMLDHCKLDPRESILVKFELNYKHSQIRMVAINRDITVLKWLMSNTCMIISQMLIHADSVHAAFHLP